VLQWAQASLGARFVLAQGVMHVAQPSEAIAAAACAIPTEVWRLAAVSAIAALTGSALLALALNAGALEAEAAWAAAHVDEDWQMSRWGCDDAALERRAVHFSDFEAAVTVLKLVS
jgi:chaperone required for assembly of F1-ATPase